MRKTSRAAALAAAAVLTVGIAACGDDDDDATTDTTEATGGDASAGGDLEEFCSTLVEFNGAVLSSEVDDDASEDDAKAVGEELAPLSERLAASAPAAVSDAARDLDETAIQPLLDGDASAFNSDDTFAAYTDLVSRASAECDFGDLSVTAVDYSFEGVPATLTAGTYAAEMSNEGNEEHEMIVFRKAPGVTMSIEELVNLSDEESEEMVVFAGATFAPPGESGTALLELEPGDYAMVCFIPVGGGEDGPPHFTQGMLAEFTVE